MHLHSKDTGSNKIGLCLMGCGEFAATFSQSIQPLLADIDLYFASRDLNKSTQYAHVYNGSGAFGSYEEAVDDKNIDAVYICTPHYLHLDHATVAASAGKHILVEKPISSTIEDAKKIISVAKEFGVILMVAENCRFMPAVRLSKEIVEQGKIGQLRTIQIQQEFSQKPSGWRGVRHLNGGGSFIDSGIHMIHYLRYLIGDPNYLCAFTPDTLDFPNEAEDGLILLSKWNSGATGLIYHSWTPAPRLATCSISLSGTVGKIYFEPDSNHLNIACGYEHETIDIPDPLDGLLAMTREFISSIVDHRVPEITGELGLKDLEMVCKAYESVKIGGSISFNLD